MTPLPSPSDLATAVNGSLALQIFSILALLVLSASLTLAKVVFGIVASNYEETRDNAKHLKAIKSFTETPPFYESISIGRLFSNSASAILAYNLLSHFAVWTSWPLVNSLLWIAIIWFALYVLVIFIPSLLGNVRPNSLAFPTVLLYRFIAFFIAPPAHVVRKFYDWCLARLGYDPRLSFLTEDQREMLESDTTVDEGESTLEDDERQMILNIFDFVETPVREIMTPRVDMFALSTEASLEDVVHTLNHERHSRIPVFRDNMDSIVGVLHNREFLHWYTEHRNETFQLEKLLKPAIFVPYHKKIDDLLRDFRRSGNQLAIVIDEYGGTAGLVTLEDILEEIVGDIRDEDDHDEEQPLVRLKDGKFLIDPIISLSDLEFELGIHLDVPEDSHVETLSGLIHATLGSLPAQGAEVNLGRCRVKILKVEGTRMEKVLLQLNET